MSTSQKKGFTLVELLIVIAIIAIIAAIAFVALDPLTRFQDSRDARRWSDVNAIANAIVVDQVDNGGDYLAAIASTTVGEVYMITQGGMTSGCDDNNNVCDTTVTSDTNCVDLSGLVDEGYLGVLPIAPETTAVTWDNGDAGEEGTGYTLERISTTTISVRACQAENSESPEIQVIR